jgi:hypothetical protein
MSIQGERMSKLIQDLGVGGSPGERDCLNCAHSYCELDDDVVCGRPGTEPFGVYVRNKASRCGEGLPLFVEHVESPPTR